jgi:hypothetical protein
MQPPNQIGHEDNSNLTVIYGANQPVHRLQFPLS